MELSSGKIDFFFIADVFQGDFHLLPHKVQRFVAEKADLMRPRGIYICDGSQHEAEEITHKLIERGMLSELKAMENWCVTARPSRLFTPSKLLSIAVKRPTRPLMISLLLQLHLSYRS